VHDIDGQFPHQPILDDAFSVLLDTYAVVACAMMSQHTYQSSFCGSKPSYYPLSFYDIPHKPPKQIQTISKQCPTCSQLLLTWPIFHSFANHSFIPNTFMRRTQASLFCTMKKWKDRNMDMDMNVDMNMDIDMDILIIISFLTNSYTHFVLVLPQK